MHRNVSYEVLWATRHHHPLQRDYPFQRFGHIGIWQLRGGPFSICIEGEKVIEMPDGGAFVIGQWQSFKRKFPPNSVEIIQRGADVRCNLWGGLDLSRLIDLPIFLDAEEAEPLLRLTDRLADLKQQEDAMTLPEVMEVNQLGFGLLAEICRHCKWRPQAERSIREAERLQPAIALMEQSLDQPLLRKDLAASVHLSEPRFSQLFKKAFGTSPMIYLRNLRIEYAGRLLIRHDETLEAIAHRVGFHDAFHLSRTFKKLTGESPSTYRKAYKVT